METPQISIIVPTLNEANGIASLLRHLDNAVTQRTNLELILVDGASNDGTPDIARKALTSLQHLEQVQLISCSRGRARQMNAGAAMAKSDILYFLHADSFPPNHFDTLILEKVKQGHPAGCFSMRFDCNHWWLRLAGWLTQFRWRACRGGDQSQFITKTLFEELRGFDERFEIYEDNDLINKLYARNEFVVIKKKLTTSCRRYRVNGIWKLQYHFWTIYVKKWMGASAEELHQYYRKHIA